MGEQASEYRIANGMHVVIVQKVCEHAVSFAVQRRKEEYHESQSYSAESPAAERIGYRLHLVFGEQGNPCEIQRSKAAANSEQDIERYVPHHEGSQSVVKCNSISHKQICNRCAGNAAQYQWQYAGH